MFGIFSAYKSRWTIQFNKNVNIIPNQFVRGISMIGRVISKIILDLMLLKTFIDHNDNILWYHTRFLKLTFKGGWRFKKMP